MSEADKSITTDCVIVGAGPVALFAVFELGLNDISCIVIDVLDRPGGQCAELYPEKPIYDIPGFPEISGQQLVDNLLLQINPFQPQFFFNQLVTDISRRDDGGFLLTTEAGMKVYCKAVVIASGGGRFEPRIPPVPNIRDYHAKGVSYSIRNKDELAGRDLVVAGGGDSALDWAVELAAAAKSLTLVHRRDSFRASPHTVKKFQDLVSEKKAALVVGQITHVVGDGERLSALEVELRDDGTVVELQCDVLLPFFGLLMRRGEFGSLDLETEHGLYKVDTEKFETSQNGVFAIGDGNSYLGKLKLILSGFHEAALMAKAVHAIIFPDKKFVFQYTTTSTGLLRKLGKMPTKPK